MKKNYKRRDYHKYEWPPGELVEGIALSGGVVILLAYFFYRSIWAVFPLAVVGWFFFRELTLRKGERERAELVAEFRECMLSVAASMKAGYAVENAFLECREDMRMLYGESSPIYRELELIRRGLVLNITLEEQLRDLADRSGCEEIVQFVDVFCIAKRNSGNLAQIMEATGKLIGQRLDALQEIQAILGGKRMEQTVMKGMPFLVMIYIGASYRGYFDRLYHNLWGVLIMTGCLLLYLAAYVWGERTLKKIGEEIVA